MLPSRETIEGYEVTVILVDMGDDKHDLQLTNRGWDCFVTNLSRESVFVTKKIEMLAIPTVGSLNSKECKILSKALRKKFIPRLSDQGFLFWDGSIGSASPPQTGYSLDTPYHLVSHLSKKTLENILGFSDTSAGFVVL